MRKNQEQLYPLFLKKICGIGICPEISNEMLKSIISFMILDFFFNFNAWCFRNIEIQEVIIQPCTPPEPSSSFIRLLG